MTHVPDWNDILICRYQWRTVIKGHMCRATPHQRENVTVPERISKMHIFNL